MNKPNLNAIQDIVIKRTFDAPVELVWKAWTDPEQVMRWWGPKDYTSPLCKIDLREGGKYLFVMRAPQYQGGQDFFTTGVYKKIVPMKFLEFTQILSDKDGNPIDPTQIGMPADFPKEVRTEIAFKANGSKTELTVTEYNWTVGKMRDYSVLGMNQSLDKLAESLKHTQIQFAHAGVSMNKDRPFTSAQKNRTIITAERGTAEIVITREFDAPRELVFKAFTDPDLYVQWLGPRDLQMILKKFEPKYGGTYQYIHRDMAGNEYPFHGVYHEVIAPQRIIDTFEFDGLPEPGHVSLETITFDKLPDDKTRLTIQAVFQSVADRDGMLQSGMERGVVDSHDRLTELLVKMMK